MDQAEQVKKHLTTTPIEDATLRELEQESAASLVRQADIEAADTQPFADFLKGILPCVTPRSRHQAQGKRHEFSGALRP